MTAILSSSAVCHSIRGIINVWSVNDDDDSSGKVMVAVALVVVVSGAVVMVLVVSSLMDRFMAY